MSLLSYWPTKEEVDRCIKSEAEAVSEEVLLAAHQQFPLAYSKIDDKGRVAADSRQTASEDDLLRYLLGSAPEGSLVVPITGASGVGKSHLIRMLDARLSRLPNASRYLVIRIPKSASLRRVVELILEAEPLQVPKYDSVRAEFEKALADVPLETAVIHFQAELEIALRDYEGMLTEKLRQGHVDPALQERVGVARLLPQLLTDAETTKYFRQQVLPRIIHRAVEGVVDPNVAIDPADSQFKAADFDFPDSVEISKAAIAVRNFYLRTLCAFSGKHKATAADVLNQVVDQATRQLYKLNESLGGKTLGEVIGEIRSLLLSDQPNKELILLVEDFAALVGIQDTLAKILIQHGETDGQKTHATIRSVIAVTDGYLAGRDTLATRAGREWVVESRLNSEEEVLSRTRKLVASYLNAARHGEAKLKAIYRQPELDVVSGTHLWLAPMFSEGSGEHETILDAFGRVENVPLFPFTEDAIDCLARSTLTAGNTLVFNPRFVIKNVIRDVLLTGRDAYENSQFPPPGISGKPLAADVAQWLSEQSFSEDVKRRYGRFIAVWGNQPNSKADIGRIPKPVFEAFGLPFPNIEPQENKVTGPKTTIRTARTPPEVHDLKAKDVQTYQAALERWVQNGTLLEQKIAHAIRQAIATLMNQRIDWNAEGCLKWEVKRNQFSIPNAGGEGQLDADPVKVAESTKDPDGRLRGDLLALLRYVEVYKETTDYDEVDEDLARVGNLIDRLRPEVIGRIRSAVTKQTQSAITLLAANSRLLGLTEKGCTPAAVSSFLFGDVEPLCDLVDAAPQAFKDWRQMQRNAFQIRSTLIQLVLETSGCFQGTGKTAYGVDIVGLIECYPNETSAADFADLPSLSPELRSSLRSMGPSQIGARFRQVCEAAKKMQALIVTELEADFDKQAVIDTVKAVATNLKEMGAWPTALGFSTNDFLKVCESFRSSAVKDALATLGDVLADGADESANAPKQISRVSQIPFDSLVTAQRFIGDARAVTRAAASHAQTLEKQYEGIMPAQKAKELTETFANLIADLGQLQ
ncbi:MAG: protein DpdH [Methylococcaceae bacterium]|nr:protein DpdH [Methylococcaceae bacterium]